VLNIGGRSLHIITSPAQRPIDLSVVLNCEHTIAFAALENDRAIMSLDFSRHNLIVPCSAASVSDGYDSQALLDPSMSVNRKVRAPMGLCCIAPIMNSCLTQANAQLAGDDATRVAQVNDRRLSFWAINCQSARTMS